MLSGYESSRSHDKPPYPDQGGNADRLVRARLSHARAALFARLSSSKGGVGKTTCAALCLSALLQTQRTIAVLDCDPNQHLANWVHKLNRPQLRTYAPVTLDNFYELYDKARAQSDVVLLDLPGTETIVTTYAISAAELVVVPLRASHMDAVMALKGVRLVRQQARTCRRSIPCVAVLTQTRPEGMVTRNERHLVAQLEANQVPVLPVRLVEREVYRTMFAIGQSLFELPAEQASHERALGNTLEERSRFCQSVRAFFSIWSLAL